ncbi:MAG: ATP-binding protein [Chloroflexi bacterium]|nr:ATP-binding protein [Chloroflexota bacterium]
MFNSIRWRIAITFVIVILACIAGLSIYLVNLFKNTYIDNLRIQITNQAFLIEDDCSTYFAANQIDKLNILAKKVDEQIGMRVTIIDKTGFPLADSVSDVSTMENHSNRPEVVKALSGQTGSSIRRSETLGYNMLYVAVPVKVNSEIVGVIRISLPLITIQTQINDMTRNIAIGAAIAAFITILVALIIAKTTIVPLKKLTEMSKRISEGEIQQNIEIYSNDEFGELAGSFNRMSARINNTITLLKSERDTISTILSSMGDGIFILDINSKIIMVNTAAKKFFNLQENPSGSTFIELVRDYEINDLILQCLKTRKEQTGSVFTTPDRKFLRIVVTPLEDKNGGCMLLIQDLTEMRNLQTVRRDFVSNLSHEIRTPLATIKAIVETLQQGAIKDTKFTHDFLEKLDTETDRIIQMIQELSELSRIESGKIIPEKSPLDIGEVIDVVKKRLKIQADRANLQIHSNVSSDVPMITADRRMIEQVLINLVYNAIKFTPAGGQIDLTAIKINNMLRVSIHDTGIGIPSDDLPRVFERFYTVDKSRSSGGTGLGLAIAKHIIEAHKGKIWAESVEGRGSTFYFTIPI